MVLAVSTPYHGPKGSVLPFPADSELTFSQPLPLADRESADSRMNRICAVGRMEPTLLANVGMPVGSPAADRSQETGIGQMQRLAHEEAYPDSIYIAGDRVPSGIYRELGTGREIELAEDGVLPASLDGRVAAYACVEYTWKQHQERAKSRVA